MSFSDMDALYNATKTYLYCKAVEDADLMDQKYSPDRLDSRTFVDLVPDPAMVVNNPK